MSRPKRSPVIGNAQDISAQDRTTQSADYNAAQGTNAQFEGPVQQSPFYKALLRSGTEATSNAYQQAESNVRGRAKAAGFGDTQPVEQGADAQLQSQEAKSMAALPDQAMIAAAPLSLQASSQTAGMGTAAGQQGEGYFTGGVVPLEQQYQQYKNQYQNKMWDTLQNIGSGAIQGAALA